MAKKKRRTVVGKPEERGYRVVDPTGRPVYHPSHPEGLPEKEAQRLAAGILNARVISLKKEDAQE